MTSITQRDSAVPSHRSRTSFHCVKKDHIDADSV